MLVMLDTNVRMISAEAPILFVKACELLILELTIRSFHLGYLWFMCVTVRERKRESKRGRWEET
jgi:hypothetical protein